MSDKTTLINMCDPQKNYNETTNRIKSDTEWIQSPCYLEECIKDARLILNI